MPGRQLPIVCNLDPVGNGRRTGMLTSVHVSDDSAFCAPSAASAALLVGLFSPGGLDGVAEVVVVLVTPPCWFQLGFASDDAGIPLRGDGGAGSGQGCFHLDAQRFQVTASKIAMAPGPICQTGGPQLYLRPALRPAFAWIFVVCNAVSQFALLDRRAVNPLLWYRQMCRPAFFSSASVLSANLTSCAPMASHALHYCCNTAPCCCSIMQKPHGGGLCFDTRWVTAGSRALHSAAALPASPALLSRRLVRLRSPDKYQLGAADQQPGQPLLRPPASRRKRSKSRMVPARRLTLPVRRF